MPKSKEPKKKRARTMEPAPGSMTLRFRGPRRLQMFLDLCRRTGYHGTIRKPTEGADAGKTVVTVTGFKNLTAYKNLTALWATISLNVEEETTRHESTARLF